MAQYEEIYDESNLTAVDTERTEALSDLEQTYGDMISNTDSYYDKLSQNAQNWGDKQTEIQNQQLAFTEEKIEQQREQAHKDYIKEQSGAYTDWQKQSNQYGANAEKMAAQGLQNTGYSETSQVSMYNTYQNRVATAREAFAQATLNYDNAIKEARLQNSAALAEIAYQTYQQQLELSLQGFQYKNSLISELTDKELQTKQYYSNEYQRVLDQINAQNALAEEVRQFNLNYEEQVRQFNEEMERLKAKDSEEAEQAAAELEQRKAELDEEKRQFDAQMEQKSAQITGGSSGNSSGGSGGGSSKLLDNHGVLTLGDIKSGNSTNSNKSTSAKDYFNAMIASGATKSQVSAEISKAVKEGVITQKEATELRKLFVPIGVEY